MRAFARLLDQLAFTPSRNAKLTLLRDYLGSAPDPERGWALASLTGALTFDAAKPGFIRKAAEARLDPLLFSLSYDFTLMGNPGAINKANEQRARQRARESIGQVFPGLY